MDYITNPIIERSVGLDLASLPLSFAVLVFACAVVTTYLNRRT